MNNFEKWANQFGYTSFGEKNISRQMDRWTDGEWSEGSFDNPQINSGGEYNQPDNISNLDNWRNVEWKNNPSGLNAHGEQLPSMAQQWDYYGNAYYGEGIVGWAREAVGIMGDGLLNVFDQKSRAAKQEIQKTRSTEGSGISETGAAHGAEDVAAMLTAWKNLTLGGDATDDEVTAGDVVASVFSIPANIIDVGVKELIHAAEGIGIGAQKIIGTPVLVARQAMNRRLYERALAEGVDALPGWKQDEARFMLSSDDAIFYTDSLVNKLGGSIVEFFGGERAPLQAVKGGANLQYLYSETPWMDAWKASKMFYTMAASGVTLEHEFHRRVQAGENPSIVASEMKNPYTQGFFELFIDPLEAVGVIAKGVKFTSNLADGTKYFGLVEEVADGISDIAKAVDAGDDAALIAASSDVVQNLSQTAARINNKVDGLGSRFKLLGGLDTNGLRAHYHGS
jgi:hypothetical protein